MIKQITLAILGLCLTTSAMAKHIYYGMQCSSEKYRIVYDHNYAVGGDYKFAIHGSGDLGGSFDYENANYVSSAQTAPGSNDTPQKLMEDWSLINLPEVIYTLEKETNVSETGPKKECEYDHSERRSTKHVKIKAITPTAAAKLAGLKIGESLRFFCTEKTDIPNDIECNK